MARKTKTLSDLFLQTGGQKIAEHLDLQGGALSADYGKRYSDYISIFLHFVDHEGRFISLNACMLRCEHKKKDSPQVTILYIHLIFIFFRYGRILLMAYWILG